LLIVLVCASNRQPNTLGPVFLRHRTITIAKEHVAEIRALALVV
jgi:hypothetical protein